MSGSRRGRGPARRTPVLPWLLAGLVLAAAVVGVRIATKDDSGPTRTTVGLGKDEVTLVDRAERRYRARHRRYTGEIADLVQLDPTITTGGPGQRFDLDLHASTDGRTYVVHLTGRGVNLLLSRTGVRIVASIGTL
jgi:hypothetical protein